MPFRSARRRAAIRFSLACLGIILIVPVCATHGLGGADWVVSDSISLSWYGDAIAWLLLAALAAWAWVAGVIVPLGSPHPPAQPVQVKPGLRWTHGLASLGLALAALAIGIFWSGGLRLSFLSLRSAGPAAGLAAALLLVSTALRLRAALAESTPGLAALGSGFRWVGAGAIAGALGAGLMLYAGLVALDARTMTRAIETSASRTAAESAAETRPDVIWIVVDTLRADALGAYAESAGRGSATRATAPRTPFLDSLAERSVVFERALAPAPWTVPSMFSALTSRWPSSLDPEGRGRAREAEDRVGLDRGVPTWVDALRESGYHTAAFQKNPFLGEGSGLETRFDLYRVVEGDRAEGESGAQLVNATLRWADAMQSHRDRDALPFLLYVHFMDPHIDYAPPEAWLGPEARRYSGAIDGHARTLHHRLAQGPPIEAAERAQLERLYAAEVAYLDAQLARLWAGLEARSLVDQQTLVVVTGDHGEQFGEHGGWEHGDLFTENLHVPFMVAGAGHSPGRVAASVSLLDLGPTLLDRLELPPFEGAEGRSLLGEEGARMLASSRPIVSEYGERGRLEWGRWVLIEARGRTGAARAALYDRFADPGEVEDLAALHPDQMARLRDRLARHRDRVHSMRKGIRPREVDRALERELEALGYGDSTE